MTKRTNWVAWGLAVVLAALVLAARLHPYWIARYGAESADLPGAGLSCAALIEPEVSLGLLWGSVSPGGHLILTHFYRQREPEKHPPAVVVSWDTGKILGWRRIPSISFVQAWTPEADLIVREEGEAQMPLDKEIVPEWGGYILVCRRIPGLSEEWRTVAYLTDVAWSPDGKELILTQRDKDPKLLRAESHARVWNLVAVSRSGRKRVLARSCRWIPHRVIRHRGRSVVVCSSGGAEPAPLALLRMDGSMVSRVGPALPHGYYLIPRQLDRFAWQAVRPFMPLPKPAEVDSILLDRLRDYAYAQSSRPEGACFVALKRGQTWQRTQLRPPPAPPEPKDPFQRTYSHLVPSGDDQLMWYQDGPSGLRAWRVTWSGRFVGLQLPPRAYLLQQIVPWVDGYHLLRGHGNRLELIDGHTGQIVRQRAVDGAFLAPTSLPDAGADNRTDDRRRLCARPPPGGQMTWDSNSAACRRRN